VSDVPLGAFLSGGIDSSIMVAAMAQASTDPPKTFSIGFTEGSYDELEHARRVAAHCGTDHHEEILTPDYLAMVPEVIGQLDQPIADFSVFPTLLVSRMARRHVTVALSGDGGDELFGGYDAYAATTWRERSRSSAAGGAPGTRCAHEAVAAGCRQARSRQPAAAFHGRRGAADAAAAHALDGVSDGAAAARARIRQSSMRRLPVRIEPQIAQLLDNGARDRLGNQSWCDFRLYLCENILPKVDLMSMATSLEARVPYLDNDLIDLAMNLPAAMKIRGGVRKYILKQAFAGLLPPDTLSRGKEGFSIPLKNWLLGAWNA
jgi:asparagine synthase (glutamine-hydrolysing)